MYFGMGLLLIGLFLHTRKKFPKLSCGLICAGVLFPLLAFNAGISDLLNRRLEFQYPAMPVKRIDHDNVHALASAVAVVELARQIAQRAHYPL